MPIPEHTNPAVEVGALVTHALSPPLMGVGGGSATEEQSLGRWKRKGIAELDRLRVTCGPPLLAPELHTILDCCSLLFGKH